MNAIVVTDEAAGTAGMTLVERPQPQYGACGRTPFERVAPALSTGSCRLSEGRRSTQR
jgi:hypothetical protein